MHAIVANPLPMNQRRLGPTSDRYCCSSNLYFLGKYVPRQLVPVAGSTPNSIFNRVTSIDSYCVILAARHDRPRNERRSKLAQENRPVIRGIVFNASLVPVKRSGEKG